MDTKPIHPATSLRVLITGGAGFIGSHLVERMLQDGATVYVLDNLSTGRIENLNPVRHHPKLRFVEGSILDDAVLHKLVGTCQHVIHLAAAVGVRYILDNPLESIMTNVVGTEKVLRACSEFEKPLFLASTSEVYGIQSKAPLREEDNCVLGATSVSRWSYACSKALDEFMALAYHQQGKFPVTIARLFNTVGPRQSAAYGMVMPRFVDQALSRQPLTVFGDGTQTRTFTHVCDLIEAIMRLVAMPTTAGQIYNIGGQEEISMHELARRIIARTESTSAIEFIPLNKVYNQNFEDMPRRVPDTTRLYTATNFRPTISLNQIMDDVIADRKTLSAP
jgi:UDP-glucose 4-epimerase